MNITIQLSGKLLKYKKKNGLLLAASFILVSILFSVVFCIAQNILSFQEISCQLATGSNFHAELYEFTESDREVLSQAPEVKECYYLWQNGQSMITDAKGNAITATCVSIEDTKALEHMFITLTEGRYPTNGTEIIADKDWLMSLGITPKLGMKITFTKEADKKSSEYTLCGYYHSDSDSNVERCVFTKEFGVGSCSAFLIYYNTINIEGKTQNLCSRLSTQVQYTSNGAFTFSSRNSITVPFVISLLIVVAIVFFSGYLIIYNIFSITIQQEIKSYGLYKILGMSEKQLFFIGLLPASFVFFLSAPIGLGLGYLIGFRTLAPIFMILSGKDYSFAYQYSGYLPVLILAFSYMTAVCSTIRPIQSVCRMTCLEALNPERKQKEYRKKKTLTFKSEVVELALHSIFDNRKRTRITILSIAMTGVLLMLVPGIEEMIINSVHLRKSDFCIAAQKKLPPVYEVTTVYPDEEGNFIEHEQSVTDAEMATLPEQTYEMLLGLNGVTKAVKIYVATSNLNSGGKNLSARIVSIPAQIKEYLNLGTIIEGSFDEDAFFNGAKVIINSAYQNKSSWSEGENLKLHVGDELQLGNNSYLIDGICSGYDDLIDGVSYFNLYNPGELVIFMSEVNFMQQFADIAAAKSVDLWIQDEYYQAVKYKLTEYERLGLTVIDRREVERELSQRIQSIRIVGYSLSVILLLIGIMNYINTVLCGIYAREHELALLEVVGMTRTQTIRMLLLENLIYLIFITLATFILGGMAVHIIAALVKEQFDIIVWPSLIMIGLMGMICLILLYISIRIIDKKTVVEKLRV